MQDAKRLAQGCEATDNARGIRGHAAPDTFCHLECQIRDFLRFLLIFSTYDSSKVNYILHNNILNFHLWIYNEFIFGGGLQRLPLSRFFQYYKNGHGCGIVTFYLSYKQHSQDK